MSDAIPEALLLINSATNRVNKSYEFFCVRIGFKRLFYRQRHLCEFRVLQLPEAVEKCRSNNCNIILLNNHDVLFTMIFEFSHIEGVFLCVVPSSDI